MPIMKRGLAGKKPVVTDSPLEAAAPEELPVAAEAKPVPAPAAPLPIKGFGYKARLHPIRHPYQNVLVPVDVPIPLVRDNWVEVQVQAQVLIEVEL